MVLQFCFTSIVFAILTRRWSLLDPWVLGLVRWRAMSREIIVQPSTGHHFFSLPLSGAFPFWTWIFPLDVTLPDIHVQVPPDMHVQVPPQVAPLKRAALYRARLLLVVGALPCGFLEPRFCSNVGIAL